MPQLVDKLVISFKFTHKHALWHNKSTPMNWRNKPVCLQKDIYKNMHSSSIRNSLRLEGTQMPFNRRKYAWILDILNKGRLVNNTKKKGGGYWYTLIHRWISKTCWMKDRHRRYYYMMDILYDFIYKLFSNREN